MLIALTPTYIRANIDALLDIASDVPGEYWTIDNFLHELPRKWELSFAVEGPVAYCIASDKSAPHLHHLMVHRDYRGKGLGKLMMDELFRRAPNLTLKVHRKNTGAIRFYDRLGFETVEVGEYLVLQRGHIAAA